MTETQKARRSEYFRGIVRGLGATFAYVVLAMRTPLVTLLFLTVLLGVPLGIGVVWLNIHAFPRWRRAPLVVTVLANTCCYLALILFCFLFSIWLNLAAINRASPLNPAIVRLLIKQIDAPEIRYGMGFAFAVVVFFTFLAQIGRKLGPGVLNNWLLGRYRTPREEDRIFMFLDIKGSTALAETLGNLQFSALIRDFFADLTTPVVETQGEVSHFIGDEAVLTWRVERGFARANCLRCFFLMQAEIGKREPYYRKTYGIVPGFKAGVHVGRVVAAEVGEIKSEIVYHGDVLNTASRIQSLCGSLGSDLLVSGEAAQNVNDTADFCLESVGSHLLKGKEQPLELYRVSAKQRVTDSLS